MQDKRKTKDQLIDELRELRHRVSELEASEAEQKEAENILRNYINRIKILHAIDHDILTSQSLKDITASVLCHINKLIQCDRCSTVLFDFKADRATVFTARCKENTAIGSGQVLSTEEYGIAEELFKGKVHLVKDLERVRHLSLVDQKLKSEGLRSYFNVPLMLHGKLAGSLNIGSHSPDAFTHEDVGIVSEIAGLLVVAMQQSENRERLKESEEKFRSLAEQSPNMIFINKKGRVVYVNEECVKILGYTREEFLSDDFNFLSLIGSEDLESVKEKFNAHMKGEEIAPYEYVLLKKNGERIDALNATKLIHFEGEKAILGIVTDITERKRIEKALKESEEKFRDLFENAVDPIFIVDSDLYYIDVNKRAVELFGYSREEFLQMRILDLIPPDQIPKSEEVFNELKTKGSYEGFQGKMGTKAGLWLDIEVSSSAMIKDGRFMGSRDIVRDITERKKIERSLSESEEKYRHLIENANEGILIAQDGTLKYVNPMFTKMTGFSQTELTSRPFIDFIHPYDREKVLGRHHKRLEGEINPTEIYSFRVLNKDGDVRFLEIKTSISKWEGRLATVNFVSDITERRMAEESLRESEQRFRQLAEAAFEGIVITEKGKILEANNTFAALFGYDRSQMIGLHVSQLVAPEHREDVIEKMRSGYEKPYETVCLRKDGSPFPIEVCGKSVRYQGRKVRIAAIRDLAERKRLEEEILKTQKLESLGILAGGLAHDFNNLLTAILGNISLAKMHVQSEERVYERLTEAEKASERAKDLTQQLLTFSKGGEPIKKTVSIGELIKESVFFSLRGSNVRCEFSMSEDLWPAEVDEGQINQVINNLAINAKHAMPEGGMIEVLCKNVHIHRRSALPLQGGEYIEISIRDQGTGIMKEHVRKVFDPYFTTKQEGSGLGLATAHSIVKKHSGHITVESQLGVGTVFRIFLPASVKEVHRSGKGGEGFLGGKGKILIMDDEDAVREVAGVMLTDLGYDVEFAENGDEAIHMYEKAQKADRKYDAVIMDLTIPGGMGGKEALEALLKIDPEVRAIVSSGYSNNPIMADYEKYGFLGVITKPYKIDELSREVRKLMLMKEDRR